MLRTQWKVVTSEETSGSLVLSISWGKIYLVNENDKDDTLTIKYRCISAGESKGPPVGANWSSTSDPSGGVGNVSVVDGHYFGHLSFPCHGYMIGVAASLGVAGSIAGLNRTGGNLTEVLFGMAPVFAGVRLYGLGHGVTPGIGFGGGIAVFEEV
jgi:hypothetical protein